MPVDLDPLLKLLQEDLEELIVFTKPNSSKKVRDFALVDKKDKIDLEETNKALDRLKVDEYGLNEVDPEILNAIITKFNGGPVEVEAIASY